jgi:ABC-2 type transport system permease protein
MCSWPWLRRTRLITDIATIVWKESKESVQGSSKGGSLGRLAFPIVLAGIFVPLRLGSAYVTGGAAFLGVFWILPMIAGSLAIDMIAGERERHTLESLLATRLPDAAVVLGKIAASVLYACGMMIASLILGLLTVNLTREDEAILLFSPAYAAALVAFSFLAAIFVCGVAVLVSLRASTVRQAAQTFAYGFTGLLFATIFAIQALPASWRSAIAQMLGEGHRLGTALTLGAILMLLDVVVLVVASTRFRRPRLTLD